MPLREFGCYSCGTTVEKFFWHSEENDGRALAPSCCNREMSKLWSIPNIDTSSTFRPFQWRGPTGLYHEINNLHQLRQVEHTYQETGHNVRFDAYSAEPSNPNPVDGFGPEYWDGNPNHTSGKAFALPTQS